jgi:hypothetical protein
MRQLSHVRHIEKLNHGLKLWILIYAMLAIDDNVNKFRIHAADTFVEPALADIWKREA